MSTKNIFLTKGAKVEELRNAMPKEVSVSGFVITDNMKDSDKGIIEYVGNPKALKFVIPKMVAVVESLGSDSGFSVIKTPKTYLKKDGSIGSTNKVIFGFTNVAMAQILCDNVNTLCKADYENYLSTKNK